MDASLQRSTDMSAFRRVEWEGEKVGRKKEEEGTKHCNIC